MLGKNSADNILKYFFLIFLENKLSHFMQIVSAWYIKDYFLGKKLGKKKKKKKKKNIISLSPAEFAR